MEDYESIGRKAHKPFVKGRNHHLNSTDVEVEKPLIVSAIQKLHNRSHSVHPNKKNELRKSHNKSIFDHTNVNSSLSVYSSLNFNITNRKSTNRVSSKSPSKARPKFKLNLQFTTHHIKNPRRNLQIMSKSPQPISKN